MSAKSAGRKVRRENVRHFFFCLETISCPIDGPHLEPETHMKRDTFAGKRNKRQSAVKKKVNGHTAMAHPVSLCRCYAILADRWMDIDTQQQQQRCCKDPCVTWAHLTCDRDDDGNRE